MAGFFVSVYFVPGDLVRVSCILLTLPLILYATNYRKVLRKTWPYR